MTKPRLLWDVGTAYDLFTSLDVLHRPQHYRLRPAWAAGMRARLPASARETLEQAQEMPVAFPVHWLHGLPEPKDAQAALQSLRQIPAAERLPLLVLPEGIPPIFPPHWVPVLRDVAARAAWDEQDLEQMMGDAAQGKGALAREKAVGHLERWAQAADFGERLLEALQLYVEVFFAEEEKRILPALQAALAHARKLAQRLSLPALLEELSQGLRLEELPPVSELVIVPSYWTTTRVYFGYVSPDRYLWMYGARPPEESLVPGLPVPDTLLRRMQALSDPTRLRILSYLDEGALAPAQLAKRLRLRLSTVLHHLDTLRVAGLVQLTIAEAKEKKLYAARPESIAATYRALQSFLSGSDEGELDDPGEE